MIFKIKKFLHELPEFFYEFNYCLFFKNNRFRDSYFYLTLIFIVFNSN